VNECKPLVGGAGGLPARRRRRAPPRAGRHPGGRPHLCNISFGVERDNSCLPVGVRNRRLNIKLRKLLRVGHWDSGPVRAEHVAAAARAREPRLGRSSHTCVFHPYLYLSPLK